MRIGSLVTRRPVGRAQMGVRELLRTHSQNDILAPNFLETRSP
jgi:hypothetical protein